MTNAGLTISGLHAGYGRLGVLRDIDLVVSAGEVVAVVGPNGAGKTTLLRAISGLLRPTAGSVRLGDTDVTSAGAERIAALGLAHVPENRLVFPSLTVADNLQLGGWTRRRDGRHDERRAQVLDLFPRLADRLAQVAGSLSGGEQQMVAVGRALMADPSVLVLDEPSLGLAPKVVGEIIAALGLLRAQRDLAILLIEQNTKAAFTLADRVLVMERGRVVASGTTAELAQDDRLRSAYLGPAAPSAAAEAP